MPAALRLMAPRCVARKRFLAPLCRLFESQREEVARADRCAGSEQRAPGQHGGVWCGAVLRITRVARASRLSSSVVSSSSVQQE